MVAPPSPAAAALTGPALHEAKRATRAQVIAARDALDHRTWAAASAVITRTIRALPSFRDARCILMTLPFRSEWDTRELFATARAAGKVVVLPRVNGDSRMLDLHAVTAIDAQIEPGYRGIPEPAATCPPVALAVVDWVLVPGVAFDPSGRRLGYGGGYYDRLLALLAPGTPRIAGAFDLQVVARVPAAPHDLVVDAIVTETRTLTVSRPA
jgi:5-formyltetrahydrofolate cyclo-ligase